MGTSRPEKAFAITDEDIEATSSKTPGGLAYRTEVTRRLFSPRLLLGRELPHVLDIAWVLRPLLDPIIKQGLSFDADVLGHPLWAKVLADKGPIELRGCDFSARVRLRSGRSLALGPEGIHTRRAEIAAVDWPDDTCFGLCYVPDLMTAWKTDLAWLSDDDRIRASKRKLLLRGGHKKARERRAQSFGELEPNDRKRVLDLVEVSGLRSLDPLMSGIIVRGGVFEAGERPKLDSSLASQAYKNFDRFLGGRYEPLKVRFDAEEGSEPPSLHESLSPTAAVDLEDEKIQLSALLDRCSLTKKERLVAEEILRLDEQGDPGGEAAGTVVSRRLGMSKQTYWVHTHNIQKKLKARGNFGRD